MPMPHRTFAEVAKRRLVGKDGSDRVATIRALLEELPGYRNGPYADLRKWLEGELDQTRMRAKVVHRDSLQVRREGASQIALVGPPNAGKSSLLQALSQIQIKTGDYAFTTLRPVPALTRIGGVLVQLVEIPGLIEGAHEDRGGGRALLGVLRNADAIVFCRAADEPVASLDVVRAEVAAAGIEKPAMLALTKADEVEEAVLADGSGLDDRSGLDPRRREPRSAPRRDLAPDRLDPGLPAPRRARGRRALRALRRSNGGRRRGPRAPRRRAGVHGRADMGAVRPVRRSAGRARPRRRRRGRRRGAPTVSPVWEDGRVRYTVFHVENLEWKPRREGDPRLVSELSDAMTRSRANLFRYPPGAIGRRHIDHVQEEVFVVLDGTLTIHMGEGDDPERHELAAGSVLVVQSGTALQLSNRGGTELRLFIYGAPPERGEATFLPTIE